jgi:hypothetical protein
METARVSKMEVLLELKRVETMGSKKACPMVADLAQCLETKRE